jgi:hypothetical protein
MQKQIKEYKNKLIEKCFTVMSEKRCNAFQFWIIFSQLE